MDNKTKTSKRSNVTLLLIMILGVGMLIFSNCDGNNYDYLHGTWKLSTPWGNVVYKLDKGGSCCEMSGGEYLYGTYEVSGNKVLMRFNGEPGVTYALIKDKRLYDEKGGFYKKIR